MTAESGVALLQTDTKGLVRILPQKKKQQVVLLAVPPPPPPANIILISPAVASQNAILVAQQANLSAVAVAAAGTGADSAMTKSRISSIRHTPRCLLLGVFLPSYI